MNRELQKQPTETENKEELIDVEDIKGQDFFNKDEVIYQRVEKLEIEELEKQIRGL